MQGYDGLNRAVDGDVVAVELLPEDQWSAPSEIILQNDDVDDEGNFFPFRLIFFLIIALLANISCSVLQRRLWKKF